MPPHAATACAQDIGPLAQLVEHWTFNPLVAGSTPARPTNSNNNLRCFRQRRETAIPKTFPKLLARSRAAAGSADTLRNAPCCNGRLQPTREPVMGALSALRPSLAGRQATELSARASVNEGAEEGG